MKETEILRPTDNHVINLALDTINKNKQALVFVNSKRSAEKSAEDISKQIKNQDKQLDDLSEEILRALQRPTKQCERLAKCIKKGIAFHHAGLVSKQRELIENSFRKGIIKIICSTPTLALGVDLPAFRVIIKDLKRYGGPYGMAWIPVLEYLQQSGRAGRPSFDKYGESIAIASTEKEKDAIYENYILGEPEDIYSKLAVEPVLRTYLLSLIATEFVENKKEIISFFERTFWAHQYEDMKHLEGTIIRMLNLLHKWKFIEMSIEDDFVSGDEILNDDVKATILGKRVSELYLDPLTANFIIECLKNVKKDTPDFAFLQMVAHTIEMRPLLRARVKEIEEIEEKLVEFNEQLLEKEPDMFDTEYDDFINSIKTALFFKDWIEETDEESLLEKYNIRPGEIKYKLDNADWLLYAAEELSRILKMQNVIKEIVKIRLRAKYGVKEELLALLKLKGIGRVRARKLYFNKIKTIGDVKKAELGTLVQILGRNVALNVKEQVGQKFIKVKENKRKGQISLNDY
ncbi:MAG: helicase-related protein [Candidatus Nanoarchaeia archaeon]|nr:helicase-related protein [Candidatus Nanoarchaeia archaeon]